MDQDRIIEPLGNIFKTTSGGTPSRKMPEFYHGDIPWVKSGELENNIIYDTEEKITEAAIKNSSAKIFPAGTLLIALYGATIGKLAILGIKAATNQAICGIFDNGVILSKYTYYFLLFNKPKLIQSGFGGAQPNISQDIVRKQPFPIIPLPEQRAIVSKIEQLFSDLDNGIENFKKAQAQLKIYRQLVLKAACEGKLAPTEAELARAKGHEYEGADVLLARILKERREKNKGAKYIEPAEPETSRMPELPEGWCWASAEQLTTRITDGEHITPERSESGVLLLSARNVLNGELSLKDVDYVPQHVYNKLSQRLKIEAGDVLLSCSGSVGRSCVAPEGLTFSLVRSVAVLKPIIKTGNYLSYCLRSHFLQLQIIEKKTQTAQANIFQGKIKSLKFPLPPLAEQRRIVAEVERRLSVCDKMEATITESLQKAESLRQSILKKAFEGKLLNKKELEKARNAPDWEPAEKLLERIKAEKARIVEKKRNR